MASIYDTNFLNNYMAYRNKQRMSGAQVNPNVVGALAEGDLEARYNQQNKNRQLGLQEQQVNNQRDYQQSMIGLQEDALAQNKKAGMMSALLNLPENAYKMYGLGQKVGLWGDPKFPSYPGYSEGTDLSGENAIMAGTNYEPGYNEGMDLSGEIAMEGGSTPQNYDASSLTSTNTNYNVAPTLFGSLLGAGKAFAGGGDTQQVATAAASPLVSRLGAEGLSNTLGGTSSSYLPYVGGVLGAGLSAANDGSTGQIVSSGISGVSPWAAAAGAIRDYGIGSFDGGSAAGEIDALESNFYDSQDNQGSQWGAALNAGTTGWMAEGYQDLTNSWGHGLYDAMGPNMARVVDPWGALQTGDSFQDVVSSPFGIMDEWFGGDGEGTVICTELHRQGLISDELYATEREYGKTLPMEIMDGYHAWAIPVVEMMRKSKPLTNLIHFLAKPVLNEMASHVSPAFTSTLIGCVMLSVGKCVCSIIGNKKVAEVA